MSTSLGTPLMSTSGAPDPFHFVRDDLSRRIDEARIKYDNWTYALTNTNTAKNGSFKSDTAALKTMIEGLLNDVRLLGGTLTAVEADRTRFAHISEAELETRRRYIQEQTDLLTRWKNEMSSSRTRGKIDRDARELLHRRPGGRGGAGGAGAGGDGSRFTAANEDFLNEQAQRQEMMKKEADSHLDLIGTSVSHLGVMARTINVELDEQDRMITDLDKDVDDAQASMNVAMRQMSKLLKTKDSCQLWTILVLIVVMVILFILVIS